MRDRQETIRSKGFNIVNGGRDDPYLYNKIKVGNKTYEDVAINLSALRQTHRNYGDKRFVLRALAERNLPLLREISNFFYSTNGLYRNVCNYFAFLYRYDWYIVPEIYDESIKQDKVLKEFNNLLSYLDNSHIKKLCGDIALKVIRNGAYYAYIVPSNNGLVLQELPTNYCRSFYTQGSLPVVEFNMRYFDEQFKSLEYRMKVISMFPDDFKKGYMLYKQGKLINDDMRSNLVDNDRTVRMRDGWYPLEAASTVKFNFNDTDIPMFVTSIPAILDLDAAQALDRKKQMQQLLKILIQKLPLDKNGDLIFDVDEARDIHENAVEMLADIIGVDVLTTFADVQVEDVADNNTTTSTDDLEKVERSVYNSLGVSKNLFNTNSNLSLEKSILQDESTARDLLLQFHIFFDRITQQKCVNNKKFCFRLYMLETTQYNYKDLAKMYKEQVQIGYSKMLPQIAMGHSQSSIIHTAYFENEILNLTEIMIPPLMSSTMSSQDILGKKSSSNTSAVDNKNGETGRPEKSDSEKSEKTIANRESM